MLIALAAGSMWMPILFPISLRPTLSLLCCWFSSIALRVSLCYVGRESEFDALAEDLRCISIDQFHPALGSVGIFSCFANASVQAIMIND